MIKKLMIIGLILLIISLIGCAKKEVPVEEKITEEVTTDIDSDIADVGVLDEDLDISDLENIDKELDEINW